MPLDLIILVAAIAIAWLVFTALIKVVKTTITTALTIAAIVLLLMLVFGVNPTDLWEQLIALPQTIWRTVTGGN
ncbi:MAG: hypothetical protein LRZ84_03195 [Desertifilum sp.]|nr:hypothetical protein [Desertifilum sp.]MDI9637853.1 hypothetical protein [Geitlerinema splendidum]